MINTGLVCYGIGNGGFALGGDGEHCLFKLILGCED